MNASNKFLVAAFMTAAMLFVTTAQAMEIRQFDKMDERDRNEYVAELVLGAQKVLTEAGKADQAAQVGKLFTTVLGNDQSSLGVVEFTSNLARARLADAKRVLSDPNAHRLEVEDAMLVTLKKNNIFPSQDFVRGFRAINSNFHPKFPPQSK